MNGKLREMKNTVVHLKTQEEYDEYMDMCEDAGWKWDNDKKPKYENKWNTYKEETCVDISPDMRYADVEYSEVEGEIILTLNELKEKIGMERKWKQGDKVKYVGEIYTVQGPLGDLYFLMDKNGYAVLDPRTQKNWEELGAELYIEPKKVELTFEDISAGKGVGVDPKLIKIKKGE